MKGGATPRSILVAEPRFAGGTHATFNAGLLAAALVASKGARVGFAAEAEQIGEVKRALDASTSHALARGIDWYPLAARPFTIPTRRGDLQLARQALSIRQRSGYDDLVFASVSGYQQLLTIEIALRWFHRHARAVVLLHDNWSDLVSGVGLGAPGRARHRAVKILLRALQPSALRLGVLQRGLVADYRTLSGGGLPELTWMVPPVLDLPTGASGDGVGPSSGLRPPGERRFVLAGGAAKGPSLWFAEAAAAVSARVPGTRFSLAGSRRGSDPLRGTAVELPAGGAQLDLASYRRALRSADVCVVLLDPEKYRLRISASCLDLLACGRPGVFSRCAYVERLFAEYGPLGWICDGRDDLLSRLESLAGAEITPEYSEYSANSRRAGLEHHPDRAGERLRALLDRSDAETTS